MIAGPLLETVLLPGGAFGPASGAKPVKPIFS